MKENHFGIRLLAVVSRPLADAAVAASRLEGLQKPLEVVRAVEQKFEAVEDALALTGFALDLALAVAEVTHSHDPEAESEILPDPEDSEDAP